MKDRLHLAFFLPSMHMGGVERVTVSLIKGLLARGFQMDLVLVNRGMGAYEEEIPRDCRINDLRAKRTLNAISGLIRYLRHEELDILFGVLSHVNVAALLARKIACVNTRVIVTEHNTFSLANTFSERRWISKFLPYLMRRFYREASFIVGFHKVLWMT